MKINISNLSRGYSKAIFSISNKLDLKYQMLIFLEYLNIISHFNKVQKIIYNSILNDQIKLDFLNKIINSIPEINVFLKTDDNQNFNNMFFTLINNFMQLLIKKKIFKLIPQILFKYNQLYLNNINQIEINIISAQILNDNEKELLLNQLTKYLNKKLAPKFTIDQSIISGILIKYNDKVIDFSLKNKLSALKSILKSSC